MKLDKQDALLLHSIVFAYANSNVNLDFLDLQHLEDLQLRLSDFITHDNDNDSCSDHDCASDDEEVDDEEEYDEDSEEYEDDEDDKPVELYVTPERAASLSPIKVISPDGAEVSFEFEDIDEDDVVDALFDDGSVIIEDVFKLEVDEDSIRLHDGEEWHDFKVTKYPKSWKKVIPVGVVVGFSKDENEE